jgi:hypothetical protein
MNSHISQIKPYCTGVSVLLHPENACFVNYSHSSCYNFLQGLQMLLRIKPCRFYPFFPILNPDRSHGQTNPSAVLGA